MTGFDCDPSHAQHRDRGIEHAMLYCIPAPLLLVLEIEGQLGPTVGAFDTGAGVKESYIQRATPSQDTKLIGCQVCRGIGSIAWILGDSRQCTKSLEDEVKDVEGIIATVGDEILTSLGQ